MTIKFVFQLTNSFEKSLDIYNHLAEWKSPKMYSEDLLILNCHCCRFRGTNWTRQFWCSVSIPFGLPLKSDICSSQLLLAIRICWLVQISHISVSTNSRSTQLIDWDLEFAIYTTARFNLEQITLKSEIVKWKWEIISVMKDQISNLVHYIGQLITLFTSPWLVISLRTHQMLQNNSPIFKFISSRTVSRLAHIVRL